MMLTTPSGNCWYAAAMFMFFGNCWVRLAPFMCSQSCAIQCGTLNLSIVLGLVLPLFCGWLHHSKRSSCLSLSVTWTQFCMAAASEFASAGPSTLLTTWQTQALRHGMPRSKLRQSKESRASLLMTFHFTTWSETGLRVPPTTTEFSSILLQSGRNFST